MVPIVWPIRHVNVSHCRVAPAVHPQRFIDLRRDVTASTHVHFPLICMFQVTRYLKIEEKDCARYLHRCRSVWLTIVSFIFIFLRQHVVWAKHCHERRKLRFFAFSEQGPQEYLSLRWWQRILSACVHFLPGKHLQVHRQCHLTVDNRTTRRYGSYCYGSGASQSC